jgi:hypothetical protein
LPARRVLYDRNKNRRVELDDVDVVVPVCRDHATPRLALSGSCGATSIRLPAGLNRGLHLLDAKFKLDNLGELLAKHLDDDPEALTRSGVKNVDLYKMHTYRDAIPAARSVWVLYPGAETRFFDVNLRPACSRVADLPEEIDGVGAVPLRPEDDGAAHLTALISRLLGSSDSRA